MKNIAIIEDDINASDLLQTYLNRFSKEKGETFNVHVFPTAILFLNNYRSNYDIVFMDIELPILNGMEAAKKMREIDKTVTLIFVTNMAQFAAKGYEVDALDFIVKPLSYYNFVLKLQRALDHIELNVDFKIMINTNDGIVCVSSSSLKYVEVMSHKVIYHTIDNNYYSYGTLKKSEPILKKNNFVRCKSCYLVNLRYVTSIKGFIAVVGNEELQISHQRRKEFVKALNDYYGGGF
jgi:two-component system, LytTR family, response regulator LytT